MDTGLSERQRNYQGRLLALGISCGFLVVACYQPTALLPSATTPSDLSTTEALSPTPEATFTPSERHEFIIGQLEADPDCLLPCWWGIRPGYSKVDEVRRLFERLSEEPISYPSSDGTTKHDYFVDEIIMSFAEAEYTIEAIIVVIKLNTESTLFPHYEDYSILRTLQKYGVPDQILVSFPTPIEPTDYQFFSLALVYSQRGFIAHYDGRLSDLKQDLFCPESDILFSISLLLADQSEPTYDAADLNSDLQDLGSVLEMTEDEFARNLLDSEEDFCIQLLPKE